jgi:hypothetical protein
MTPERNYCLPELDLLGLLNVATSFGFWQGNLEIFTELPHFEP